MKAEQQFKNEISAKDWDNTVQTPVFHLIIG